MEPKVKAVTEKLGELEKCFASFGAGSGANANQLRLFSQFAQEGARVVAGSFFFSVSRVVLMEVSCLQKSSQVISTMRQCFSLRLSLRPFTLL